MYGIFYAFFLMFIKFQRDFDFDLEIVQPRRCFGFLRRDPNASSRGRQSVLLQVGCGIEPCARAQRRQHQLRRRHAFIMPAIFRRLITDHDVLTCLDLELNVSQMLDNHFHENWPFLVRWDTPYQTIARF